MRVAEDRAIGLLRLFTLARPVWTVDAAAAVLQVSASSAYRYVAVLVEAGLLTPAGSAQYVLGPAIIQYDRQIQMTDPLLLHARPVMTALSREAPGSTMLLCRRFQDTVLCVHQVTDAMAPRTVSYERGRPMPLFRGATSKILLAHLTWRELRRLYAPHQTEIAAAGLGETWEAFRTTMTRMRRAGYAVTHAEVDPRSVGLSVPVHDGAKRVVGSLSFVIAAEAEAERPRLLGVLVGGARTIEAGLAG